MGLAGVGGAPSLTELALGGSSTGNKEKEEESRLAFAAAPRSAAAKPITSLTEMIDTKTTADDPAARIKPPAINFSPQSLSPYDLSLRAYTRGGFGIDPRLQ